MSLIQINRRINWLVILLIVFILSLFLNVKNAYAITPEQSSIIPTQTDDVSLNFEEIEKNQSQENVSVDDITKSYLVLVEKLQENEDQKLEVIQKKKQEEENKRKEALRKEIIKSISSKKGCPYVWGATGPNTFDCSGLTQWAYRQNGITIPRVAASQAQAGERVERNELEVGDLIFFRTDIEAPRRISHVGMYIGNGKMIHAPQTGDVVKVSYINNYFWKTNYAWACRYI